MATLDALPGYLPGISVGDYTRVSSESTPIIIPDDNDTIEVDGPREEIGLLYSEKELQEELVNKGDREEDITASSSDGSECCFDYDSDDLDFNDEIDGDEVEGNSNIA